jgi:uncharacterized membrane protein
MQMAGHTSFHILSYSLIVSFNAIQSKLLTVLLNKLSEIKKDYLGIWQMGNACKELVRSTVFSVHAKACMSACV